MFNINKCSTHVIFRHQLEIQLLEEKQREEVRLYQIKLTQAQRHLEDLQERFRQQKEYKANITEQLQKVMEAQWHEAVRILNNGRSPGLPQDASIALDQLNSLKSRSYNNLEELLNMQERKYPPKWMNDGELDATVSSVAGDYEQFRKPSTSNDNETPVTSRQPRSRQQIESDLHRFINLVSKIRFFIYIYI